MGYRSQVLLAIGKELTPFLLLATSRCKDAEELVFKDHDTFDKDYYEGWLFRWDDIKWYDSYEEIAVLEKFIADACNDEYEMGTRDGKKQYSSEFIKFVRLGEDTNDVEMLGDGFWDIYVTRSIEC